jgi:hypothetical protein
MFVKEPPAAKREYVIAYVSVLFHLRKPPIPNGSIFIAYVLGFLHGMAWFKREGRKVGKWGIVFWFQVGNQ